MLYSISTATDIWVFALLVSIIRITFTSMIFVTGGAGFIGSNFIHHWLKTTSEPVINIDKLTYAGNLDNLTAVSTQPNYHFLKLDINSPEFKNLLEQHHPRALIHFAAESHVDRSISGPAAFIETNVLGTFNLLESMRWYLEQNSEKRTSFRFIHVSTDEVYGSLDEKESPFHERSPYTPNSPYSASKAASDHLVRAYYHTYQLPAITTNCSNNYGPFQYPEKLIPVTIQACLQQRSIPIYGDGSNIRDWLFVEDHCQALKTVLDKGRIGETYNIGGQSELSNLKLIETVCSIMDDLVPRTKNQKYSELKTFVKDRPGHDWRYAIDISKISSELGWAPQTHFSVGLRKTIQWYLQNQNWIQKLRSKDLK